MRTFKQTLSDDSLGILEKMLLSKDARLKKKTKKILSHRRIYHTAFTEYEKAHNQILEALYFYGILGKEELIQ